MNYFEEQKRIVSEALSKDKISEEDYIAVWNNYSGANNDDGETFSETNLSLVIKMLNKMDFEPSHHLIASAWSKSVLLDNNFVEFVKKYEEKILAPGSILEGEFKKHEHQSLIFSHVCNLSSTRLMGLLSDYKKNEGVDWEEYTLIKEQMLDFLIEINRGTPAQKLECLVSVDRVLNEYQETKEALSKLCGFDKPVPFINMIAHLMKNEPTNNMQYVEEFKKLIDIYKTRKDLEVSLEQKDDEKPKKLKL